MESGPLTRIREATRGILAAVDVPTDWCVTVTFPAASDIGRDVADVCRRSGSSWTFVDHIVVDVSGTREPEVTLRRTVALDEARRTLAGCDYEAGVAIKAAYP